MEIILIIIGYFILTGLYSYFNDEHYIASNTTATMAEIDRATQDANKGGIIGRMELDYYLNETIIRVLDEIEKNPYYYASSHYQFERLFQEVRQRIIPEDIYFNNKDYFNLNFRIFKSNLEPKLKEQYS